MATDTPVSQAVWKKGIHTDLGHTANHTLVCPVRVSYEMATHDRVLGLVPFRGYTDLYHIACHTPECEIVWSILT
ncbi:Topoisomerase 1-associated factor 1 [Gossypium arboreum]|uniref:Topoisomerase 1-associated factor 1 n=1 Tax=Gossypium arboreum TaxID=29729 RepID=A0A0B0MVX4_GOSAR|nr:Topoisomerase 1-associated factor 1 [Gossypium arboreum]